MTLHTGDNHIGPGDSSTVFVCCSDRYFTCESQKVVNKAQKPVAFLEQLISRFSTQHDWLLDGLSGTGKIQCRCESYVLLDVHIDNVSI